ncbi:hypothetical protein GPK81_12300 [Blautia sp. MCC283]|nr:hypothetical protein [Blautia sp. MCC283]
MVHFLFQFSQIHPVIIGIHILKGIHKQETLEEGEIGVFFLDGDAYVKKYHQSDSGIQLISLNKKYAPIQVTSGSTLKTFGKVVG